MASASRYRRDGGMSEESCCSESNSAKGSTKSHFHKGGFLPKSEGLCSSRPLCRLVMNSILRVQCHEKAESSSPTAPIAGNETH